MDLMKLHEFIVLAEELNFTNAANRLFVSRASLTKHIKSLENELDLLLFERDNRNVSLTDAGKYLYPQMKSILDSYHISCREAQRIASKEDATIRIGYLYEIVSSFLPKICADFHREHQIRLTTCILEPETIRQGIIDGSLDLGITITSKSEIDEGYDAKMLAKTRTGIIVEKNGVLSNGGSLLPEDLSDMTIFAPHPKFFPAAVKALSEYQLKADNGFRMISEISDFGSIIPAFAMGADGVIGIEALVPLLGDDFAFVPVDGLDLDFEISLVWKSSTDSEVFRSLLQAIEAEFNKHC